MAIEKCEHITIPHTPHEHEAGFWGVNICPGKPETAADEVLYNTVAAALQTAASADGPWAEDHAESTSLYHIKTYFTEFATTLLELGGR